MIINLSLGESLNVRIALKDRLKKLNSIKNKDYVIKEMISDIEKVLNSIDKAEKAEAKEIIRSEG